MVAQVVRVSPDEVAEAWTSATAAVAALSGKFDDRIKELKDLAADLDRRQGIVQTMDEAQRLRDEADRYSTEQRAAADEAFSRAKRVSDDADTKLANAQATMAGVESTARDTERGWQELRAAQKAVEEDRQKWQIEAAAQKAALNQSQVEIEAQRSELRDLTAKVRARLSALNAVA